MIVCQAYRFKLKTDEEIEEKLKRFSGCCRLVWNKALALIKSRLQYQSEVNFTNKNIAVRYKHPGFLPNYNDMARMLVLWKSTDQLGFLKDAPSQALQQTLKDLYKAIDSAFRKGNGIGFPRFKRKYYNESGFRYPQGFSVKDNRVYLPKIGYVRFFKSQEISGRLKSITVKKYADGWYISILVKRKITVKPNDSHPVGIDVGVKKTAVLSNGYYFKPLDIRLEKRLLKAQRVLDRKQHRELPLIEMRSFLFQRKGAS